MRLIWMVTYIGYPSKRILYVNQGIECYEKLTQESNWNRYIYIYKYFIREISSSMYEHSIDEFYLDEFYLLLILLDWW